MILAAVLIVAIAAVVACHVRADLNESAPMFFVHDARPTFTVTVTPRAHLYDWSTDDDFIELR